ncbi:flagellar biosynthesis protein FlhB [Endozoicomonas montiporae]|uniref:Flagellar biosynthetic protein FlhB n=1 Tax=Endozoicomonas montiporae CL-33 TaxID=570277 RepID=A0A142BC73_9GAMM|nr:flagellar biosynthesis protein FlhB [Endozoicomonas montiporae]AMO56349.1 flagellar biosynthesis protein FliB [Endozoicomonas montiporae CL-33]
MSETDQEKTEDPTPRRLQKSREKGQVPRSRELSTALIFLVSSLILRFMAAPVGNQIGTVLYSSFALDRAAIFDSSTMARQLQFALTNVAPIVALTLGIIALAGALGQIILGGVLFNGDSLMPKLSRLSPTQWIKKVFSKRGIVELVKSVLKILLIIGCLIWLLWHNYPQLLNLSRLSFYAAVEVGLTTLANALFAYALCVVAISAIDAPFQLYDHNQRLKMTKQEVKDEHKDIEGRPEIKQKVRQLQREMANQRMMQKIPEADVIIVNPTHYSVALKYDQGRASAPFVLAKGVDEIALKMREVAKHHEVQLVEVPLLTRAIYYSTQIDQEIPDDLYLAVAQVLAYVHQLRQFRQGAAASAPVMASLDIPDSYQANGKRKPTHERS